MTALHERLAELRAENPSITNAELARAAGVSPPSVSEWFSGETKTLRWTSAQAIAKTYGVSDKWVATGEGSKRPDRTFYVQGGDAYQFMLAQKVWRVGAKGQDSLPENLWNEQNRLKSADPMEYADLATNDPRAFIYAVTDASMVPRFQPGEYFLVEPNTEPDIEDDVFVRLKEGQVFLKRLLSRRGGYRFGSYNSPDTQFHPPEDVSWAYYVAHAVPRRRIKLGS